MSRTFPVPPIRNRGLAAAKPETPVEMGATVADFVLERLRAWGIRRVFGYPGDGINGFLGALDRAGDALQFVQARHEETAAFMAAGHAKFTGELGVCLATSGPGAIHLLNGLYDAKLDGAPVLALVGQQARMSLGSGYQQEVNLDVLLADVGEYVETCVDPIQARHLVDRAARTALDRRGVAALIFPNDVQQLPAQPSPPRVHGMVLSSPGWTRPVVRPSEPELARAAAVLNEGNRVAILAGQGARGADTELVEVAELLGAGIAKALLGKDVLPDALPYVTGSIGLLGTRPSYELMQRCDTLLIVGSSFPFAEWLPAEGQARCVQVDADAARLGMRYPVDVPLAGDARETLRALIPLLRRKQERSFRAELAGAKRAWAELLERRAHVPADPLNPQLVALELSRRLPDGCLLTADSGSSTIWWAQQVEIRTGMRASLSGTLASMGSAVPYAIAAKLAHPDRPVVAFVGDGAAQMNGLMELVTVRRYAHLWSERTFVVCLFNNRDLNMVTWEQRALAGDPKYPASQTLPDLPYARLAETMGLDGIRVDDPARLDEALDQAFACERPVLLEAVVDAEIPPQPPHVTAEQTKNLAKALVKDPERAGIARKTIRTKVGELLGRATV
jgi:pyruvate dehydrogenase (quinone)